MKPTYNPVTGKYYTLLHRNPPKREKEVQLWQKPKNLKKKSLYDLIVGGEKMKYEPLKGKERVIQYIGSIRRIGNLILPDYRTVGKMKECKVEIRGAEK